MSLCAKFHAFVSICAIHVFFRPNSPHYNALPLKSCPVVLIEVSLLDLEPCLVAPTLVVGNRLLSSATALLGLTWVIAIAAISHNWESRGILILNLSLPCTIAINLHFWGTNNTCSISDDLE